MTKPISPDEVTAAKAQAIPEAVLTVFNDLITKAWDGHSAIVYQAEAVKLLLERDPALMSRQEIFDNHLLDVEPIYRDAGWTVSYDKPAWNESYPTRFTFSRPAQPRKN